jgi:two-component system sensor histidine kinase RegB
MNRAEAQEIAHRDGINLSWLVKLRWAAMIGQLVTIAVVHVGMGIELRIGPLLGLMAASLATNVVAFAWTARRRPVAPWAVPSLMVFDTLLFTLLLHLTGGPFNPFSFLYLVQIALAAVVLPARLTWALVLLSLACSGFLFLDYEELPLGKLSHGEHMRIHLIGMWVAFGVAAGFIVYFLMRVTVALAERDAELYEARSLVARQEKLASLATLAAGTAHELATPLSTIALVARELDRELSDPTALDAARGDAKLIREQVQRCRAILDSMSVRGGEFAGESRARVVDNPGRCALGARADAAHPRRPRWRARRLHGRSAAAGARAHDPQPLEERARCFGTGAGGRPVGQGQRFAHVHRSP